MRTAALHDPVVAAAVAVRRRGKSKTANWRRPEQVAVIALELDLSGDAVMRRRVEKHWDAVFRLRRAVQRGAGAASRAYLAARHERAGDPARGAGPVNHPPQPDHHTGRW
ncbi:hypothetical protein [Mycobacterium camsae]|uniref:hypothetical protein n=1 Tax=Mycobacterium gordonae TaxID=1778 RepID=UPI00197CB85E|nr:hypothetical protein [Mycobacterium gordonae]